MTPVFPVERIRAQFPALARQVHGKPLVYLDNAATSQKPEFVLQAMDAYYRLHNANVHRGLHTLSEEATELYEGARAKAMAYINAASVREIVFTRGTTESINLVASSLGRSKLKPGDQVLLTHMEHHSNIVPWQLICEQTGATIKVAPINDRGELLMDELEKMLTDKVKIVSCVHVSNALGTINPVQRIVDLAHAVGAIVVLDGAQAMPHMRVDVRGLNCDFYAFSGHKMFGPTGVGVLYGKEALLDAMPPYQGGGDMISSVSFEKTTWNELPYKFEAGTPNIAGAIGLGAAMDYLTQNIDFQAAGEWERELLEYGTRLLQAIPGVRLIGTAAHKASVLSFVVEGVPPSDLGTLIDHQGVAIRTGHHCTEPLMRRMGVTGTSRASLAFYNTKADLDALAAGLKKVQAMLT